MEPLVVQGVLLAVGFYLLLKGAHWLIEGSSGLAQRVGVSDITIGLTVVAFGASVPELVISLFSVTEGMPDLVVGTIIGSNITNIFLILGLAAALYPLHMAKIAVWREIPLALIAAVAVFLLVNDILIDENASSVLTRIDGLVLLLLFIVFLYYTYGIGHVAGTIKQRGRRLPVSQAIVIIVGGLAGLLIGGRLIVDTAARFAGSLGASQSLIGLTVVTLGTSLPELVTSLVAAYRHKADMAVGIIVGSNIFNILFVLAVVSVVAPLPFAPYLNVDMGVMIAASLLLFFAMFVGKRHVLERGQGITFVAIYLVYISYALWRG